MFPHKVLPVFVQFLPQIVMPAIVTGVAAPHQTLVAKMKVTVTMILTVLVI